MTEELENGALRAVAGKKWPKNGQKWPENALKQQKRTRNCEFREWGHESVSIRVHPWLGFGCRT